MAEKGNCCSNSSIRDKVCIHTDKVYDACREIQVTTYHHKCDKESDDI